MHATMLGIRLETPNQNITVPNKYVSAGNPITVIAEMYVTEIESPTGIC